MIWRSGERWKESARRHVMLAVPSSDFSIVLTFGSVSLHSYNITVTMTALLVFASFFALSVLRLLQNCFKRDLSWIPGPLYARASNLWRLISMYNGRQPDDIRALHAKYGKIVRIGPNIVSITDPAMVEQAFGLRNDFTKSDSVKAWVKMVNGKPVPGIVDAQDKRTHAELKKPVAQSKWLVVKFLAQKVRAFVGTLSRECLTRHLGPGISHVCWQNLKCKHPPRVPSEIPGRMNFVRLLASCS